MRFIILTTNPDGFFEQKEVEIPINPEHIVLMKDIIDYSDYCTELEMSNGSVLLVCETIQEIRDMITEG